ncbi:hypothetical protein [Natronolimnobius baerhuensis]|uniref:DUF8163 domain-containing protein n=1 Tax=Natronolimnobius baerhuensis TaxID=253108 RepID=A0A202EA47_9EURY|nr:hypothetical protein [Natronolimnobius baerhuensis]OVE85163.1 hypothetical protein B2G88_12550 [Natronolimnobius baerhuensis]
MNPLIGATSGPSLRGPGPLIALCLIVIGLWVSAGPIGLGVSIGVILTWLALGTPYAVAVGFIGLAASAPTETGTMIETAHWLPISGYALLLASDSGPAPSRRHRFLALASIACLVALAGLVYTLRPASLWLAGLTVLICTVGLTLLCHRYERYRLEQALESTNHQGEHGSAVEHGTDPTDDAETAAHS